MIKISLLVALSCNVILYDQIYRAIIYNTMKSSMTHKDFEIRNQTIENLRQLCNGQKSSYEVHK